MTVYSTHTRKYSQIMIRTLHFTGGEHLVFLWVPLFGITSFLQPFFFFWGDILTELDIWHSTWILYLQYMEENICKSTKTSKYTNQSTLTNMCTVDTHHSVRIQTMSIHLLTVTMAFGSRIMSTVSYGKLTNLEKTDRRNQRNQIENLVGTILFIMAMEM